MKKGALKNELIKKLTLFLGNYIFRRDLNKQRRGKMVRFKC